MNEIKISLDSMNYTSKPIGSEAAQISNRIGKNIEVLNCPTSIHSFVWDVGHYGHAFSPATFLNGSRKIDNFERMQLLVLDFDGGISHKEVFERAKRYDMPILFSYETFSSKEDDERFRVCFLNDIPISNPKAAKITKNLLRTIFPESDKHDNDIARMYYGGKQLLYFDQSIPTVNLESLNRNMTVFLRDKYAGNYKREIKKLSVENKVCLNKNNLLDISIQEINTEDSGVNPIDENSPNAIMLSNSNGEISSEIFYRINLNDDGTRHSVVPEKKIKKNHKDYRSSDLFILGKKCVLYREFESGSRRLNHEELFALATNIISFETGINKFHEIIKKYNYYEDKPWKYNKWKKDIIHINDSEYNPKSCKLFCPYASSCRHGKNILVTCKPKSHIKLDGYCEEFVSIEEVVQDLRQYLRAAIEADDTSIHVIKAQTSIGKTYSYIKEMTNSQQRFLVAASTNILKNEISIRAKKEGIDTIKTPSLHEIKDEIPDDVWNHIEQLYQTGQYRKVHPYIKKVLGKNEIACLQEYMEKRQVSRESKKHMITTHKKLLYLDEEFLSNFGVVLVDEDIILKSLIPSHISVPLLKLEKLAKVSTNASLIKKIETLVKRTRSKTMFTLNGFDLDEEEGADTSTDIDVPAFCLAEHFYYRDKSKEENLKEDQVVFINPVSLKKNTKYIIVSATADEEIYQYVFGDRVKFYECRKAKYEGVLNQYVGKSFSRSSINSKPGILERIIKKTGIKNLITFKNYGRGALYFGNLEGSNIYEGENLNVVATPYEAEFLYKLFPYALGLDFDQDEKMEIQTVARNGYLFKMKTYKDEILRSFQLWMIESQLEQAVGRSRLLRHDCIVNLFSNYPLRQAKIMDNFNYDDD